MRHKRGNSPGKTAEDKQWETNWGQKRGGGDIQIIAKNMIVTTSAKSEECKQG